MKYILPLIQSQKTVFRRDDLALLLPFKTAQGLSNFLLRAKKEGLLIHIQREVRAFPRYNTKELACKLRRRSYVSLETVLYEAGVLFQFAPQTIHCMSDDSRSSKVGDTTYIYHKIKDSILYNPLGINISETMAVASPERALCDLVYLYPQTQLENIHALDKKKLGDIISIYPRTTFLALQRLLHVTQS